LLSKGEAESIFEMFKTFDFVLWLLDFSLLDTSDIPAEITEKLHLRNEAKKAKDFATADALRDELASLWYKIIDDRSGVRLQKI
jgi:cysteinyl-tRNA synthetase